MKPVRQHILDRLSQRPHTIDDLVEALAGHGLSCPECVINRHLRDFTKKSWVRHYRPTDTKNLTYTLTEEGSRHV